MRYDLDTNAHTEKLEFLPWLPGNLPHDNNNVAPRIGVNFRLNDRTVLRGGYGLFFAFAPERRRAADARAICTGSRTRSPTTAVPTSRTGSAGPSGEGVGQRAEADLGRVAGARLRREPRAGLRRIAR